MPLEVSDRSCLPGQEFVVTPTVARLLYLCLSPRQYVSQGRIRALRQVQLHGKFAFTDTIRQARNRYAPLSHYGGDRVAAYSIAQRVQRLEQVKQVLVEFVPADGILHVLMLERGSLVIKGCGPAEDLERFPPEINGHFLYRGGIKVGEGNLHVRSPYVSPRHSD